MLPALQSIGDRRNRRARALWEQTMVRGPETKGVNWGTSL